MANYKFSSDIKDSALFTSGELTDGTSDYDTQADAYMNRAYQAIWNGGSELNPNIDETWWWLRNATPGILTLNPVVDTGTASVTNNSTSVTLSTGLTPDGDNRMFMVTDGNGDIQRISAHTAGQTGLTLDAVYTGTTDTAAPYKIFQHKYSLATDVMSILSPMRVYQNSRVEVIGMEVASLEAQYPLANITSGIPQAFAMSGKQEIQISHYGGISSTDLIRLDYDYLVLPDDLTDSGSEEPLIPLEYRRILSDFTAYFLLMDKQDNRTTPMGERAQSGLMAMAKDNRRRQLELAGEVGHISPRPGQLPQNQTPLRTSSGLIIG
jgi:hypothetical protein